MKRENKVSSELLRQLVTYNPETGAFTRRVRTSAKTKEGDVLACKTGHGYLKISVAGTQLYAHRAAFLYMTGEWPAAGMDVDHIDGDGENNRWSNLRLLTRNQNNQNRRGARRDSRSGLMGVIRHGRSSFRARIKDDAGEVVLLGSFPTEQEAFSAYLDAKRKLHPACTI